MKFGAELDRDWRTYINALLNRAAHKNNAGEMVTVMSKDVRRISAVFFSIPLFTNAMIIATLGAIQLWLISPLTAAVTLTGTALVIWVLAKYSTFMESKVGVYRAKDGENSSRASDIATGLRTITGLGAEQQMRERYHQEQMTFSTPSWNMRKLIAGCSLSAYSSVEQSPCLVLVSR